jgi:hypothetical protein
MEKGVKRAFRASIFSCINDSSVYTAWEKGGFRPAAY